MRSSRLLVPLLVALGAMTLAVDAVAEVIPGPGERDSRVRAALYSADEVYRITGVVGYELHIEFQPGESFVGLAAGDLDGLGYSTVGSNLFLKPKAAAVGTNLTIVTSRRIYHFDYTASLRPANAGDVTYSLRFSYPPDPSVPRVDAVAAGLQAPTSGARNERYAYCGSATLRPVTAYDDGVQTHLQFLSNAEWPAVFAQNDDGGESLVNFTVRGDTLVVHRIVRRLILRRGKQVGCVVNQAYTGAAERSLSGTTSEGVRREIRGATHDER